MLAAEHHARAMAGRLASTSTSRGAAVPQLPRPSQPARRGDAVVRGGAAGNPAPGAKRDDDWVHKAFPVYLQNLNGKKFPCQEPPHINAAGSGPGEPGRKVWKSEQRIWEQIRCAGLFACMGA
jgi:hypothetical protein